MPHPITEREAKKYSDIWSFDEYREHSPGLEMVDMFFQIARPQKGDSVLDIGCGAGAASRELKKRGLKVSGIDLTMEAWTHADIPFRTGCIWRDLSQEYYDYGYCTDVAEHWPPEFVALAVDRIITHCERAFFTISFNPDNMGALIGEALHLTVRPFLFWRDLFRELGTLHDARDLIGEGVFCVSR